MMRSISLCFFLVIFLSAISFAGNARQFRSKDSIEIVFKDTIHVRGKVVDEKGNPLRGIEVSAGYYKGLVRTVTKADGNFLLKNVQPYDTIFFDGANRFQKTYHEGSRILNVTLPELRNGNWEETIVIAKRQIPKQSKNSTIKIEVVGGIFPNYCCEPAPIGGYSKFRKDLATRLVYPEKARIANIEGMVKIEFIIDSMGKPSVFKTIQGLGYGCEEAIIDVLTRTKWKPGISNGLPYFSIMSVKVLFKLEDM